MATLALALPCLPGGADKLRDLAQACRGPRRQEFEDFHRRVGLTAERWYLQSTPEGGHVFILTLEGDPEGAVAKLGASQHPFDRWFKDRAREVHGVDFDQPLPGPPPEHVFEG
jgi:hypothetical protein